MVYSDGLCIEWGQKPSSSVWSQINLPKTLKDTNYAVLANVNYSGAGGNNSNPTKDKTVSSFKCYQDFSSEWIVIGYVNATVQNNIKQIIKY